MDESARLGFARALDLQRHGDLNSAEAAYRTLYAQAAHPKIAHMLAVALHQQQRSDESLLWFERAATRPSAAFHTNYASALLAVGRCREAEAQARLALVASPEHAGARLNLALSLEAQQQLVIAAAAFAALESEAQVSQAARRGRIRCALHMGDAQAARDALGAQREGEDAESMLLRGEAELDGGRLELAETALRVAAESEPTRTRAWRLQARLDQQRGNRGAALNLLDRALAVDVHDRAATLQRALLLLETGQVMPCLSGLQEWMATHPRDSEMHSLYLRCAQYEPEFDAPRLLAAHRRWGEMHAAAAEFVAPRAEVGRGPLRIGWLSPAFRNGPVQTFFLTTLRELGERRLSHNVLYNCNPRRDPSSEPLRSAADRWEDIAAFDDDALVQRIREDRIDVLVDLAGHAGHGRLGALARRVAPLQITWLDSFGTTGIEAMDFVLTDSISSPPGSEATFGERLLYLPHGRLCYLPPVAATRPDPASHRFISLNHFAKLNDAVIVTWARILRALPEWSLHLKGRAGDDAAVVARLRERFAKQGIDDSRIECTGYSTLPEALSAYRDAAIALDPFPFSGGANSCDALWMGLPLVTWPRDTLISRQGASLLEAVGQPQWIARDAENYVSIACALAADAAQRARWSEDAAVRVGERLADARQFADDLIEAVHRGWELRASEGFPAVSRQSA
jgi:predicted O-linked N-acetylglucosamine transferase (SPINDLY family)